LKQLAHIVDMGRLFFFVAFAFALILLLFFPIYVELNAHYDMNRRKFAFGVYAYKIFKLLGGYLATYTGGLAVHLTQKKAVLVPYSQMDSERKRFSFIKTFRLKKLITTVETGAEYLFPIAVADKLSQIWLFARGVDKNKVRNNILLSNGDVLQISLNALIYFNLFIVLKNFVIFLKEKIKIWQKKTKN